MKVFAAVHVLAGGGYECGAIERCPRCTGGNASRRDAKTGWKRRRHLGLRIKPVQESGNQYNHANEDGK